MSFPDTFLGLGVLPAFIGSLSLVNMSMDIQLFSAPMSNKALISLSCILTGKVVPVFLPNIILKTCLISQQTHSTKYTSGLYLHSSHVSVFSSSEASASSAGLLVLSSGNCISCIRLTSSLEISCPVTAENASAISLAVVLSSLVSCLLVFCFPFGLNFPFKFGLYCISHLK